MNFENETNVTENSELKRETSGFVNEVESFTRLSAGDERSRRLSTIQASIQAGTYHVSTARLADCLLRRMLQP